ncbi:DUF3857 domain-containing protein [Antarcticibacterium flavum]|uniref:DUF3857 domain-containing protein n=1 Tax=Antarcticibacterium flavum TaxID=2058175 RepID=A0A5B7X0M5_9FLAO|nr:MULTISPECIES: DUF3857 domain-containing protein [Antarcticibacterium]MCM4159889.1 hypothetical protein [Antarcticibacterium sp. W02-3]QCY68889.1 DUF3857 domain-containing protein [Antarcticibacterium flavum]
MNPRVLLPLLLLTAVLTVSGQEIQLSAAAIPSELLENANAVLRQEEVRVEISAVDKLVQKTTRIVTVLNKQGEGSVAAGQFYNGNIKIKKQQALIYNAAGEQIKKIKQKEFRDVSAVSSNDLYTDSRIQYLDYTPHSYPYTVVYESEIQNNSTVFIAPWDPVPGYAVSVENAAYHISNPLAIPYRLEEKNLDKLEVQKSSEIKMLSYEVKNIPAYEREYLSPPLQEFVPYLAIALDEFSLVGVKGAASNWQEFGKWQYDNLLAGKNELPASTVLKIKQLTAGAANDVEKARIIYQYVQDNTRYISVQLGIGGWEPMLAEDVDKLGYGDCKALTNFTKALLDSQGITSHYAVIYGGKNRRDIKENFASMQGNHVILQLPQEEEDIWLECTSQTDPFGYLGDFTDNRNVLLIKPEGGEIARTRAYPFSDNIRESHCEIELEDNGQFSAAVTRLSSGVPYGNIYPLGRQTREKQDMYYKNNWSHLKNLQVIDLKLENKRDIQQFSESIDLTGNNLVTKAGNRLLVPLNFLTPSLYSTPRSDFRKLPFEIARGATYKDTFIYALPENYEIEALPSPVKINSEFGNFSWSVKSIEKDNKTLVEVVREYVINEGRWEAKLYNDFRDFMLGVNTSSNQKAVLIATNQTK